MVEYKEFRVGDLFEFTSIRQIPRGFSPALYDGGGYPYITQKATNNGVTGFMDEVDELELISKPMIIMGVDNIANGVCYWMDEPFYANKMIGISNTNLNRRSAQYIITALLSAYKGYSYTDKISKRIVEDTWIELPSTASGTPDFDFMENYIKEIEQKHIKKLESDLDSRTENLLTVIDREDLIGDTDGLAAVVAAGFDDSGVDYAEFRVGDLFEINPTKAYTKLKDDEIMSGRETPFITTTVSNNGIRGYSDLEPLNKGNSLTASDTTTSDAIFYQADDYIGRSHVQGLQPKFDGFNKNVAMYILTAFRKSADGLYDYGTKFNRDKMRATTIKLPVTPTGQPDFDFMAQYIAHIELKYTLTDAMDERERIDLMVELTQQQQTP